MQNSPVIKINLDEKIRSGERVVVELGCGDSKTPGRIGVDHLDLPGVDIVADLNQGLSFLPDNSVDEIHSKSLLEHIDNLEVLMSEMWRVMKPGATNHIFVPHFSNPYYYSNYTHTKFMGLYTFYYFVDPAKQLRRKVPSFYNKTRFEVKSLKLVFASKASPFLIRKIFKKGLEAVFNSNSYMQELYEDMFCYRFPCYGLDIVLTPDGKDK